MKRYFFHVLENGQLIIDEEGLECPSSNALRQFATLLSGGSSSSVRLS